MEEKTTTIDPNTISTVELQQLLLTAVAPRPIALASTVDKNGNVNLSPFSFFNVFSANPPILIFSPARRIKDSTTKHTYENVKEVNEVVINIVNFPMVEQMSLSSTEYKKGINEFTKSGFTPVASDKVKPPRVAEAPISFECIVENVIELGAEGGAGNLIISRVVNIHIRNEYKGNDGNLATEKLDLVARMGGNWYCRAGKDSLFEIPKPIYSKGIGVDALPIHAINSKVLTGNDLGRLGNMAEKPSLESIAKCKKIPEVIAALQTPDSEEKYKKLHSIVKNQLDNTNVEQALSILFCI
ncbi:flavin reductase family protein [Flavobacterium nackdongense]|uniref:Flavin reductase family protein n=1 Tax=Flavobacterium nackdongense TaxID=2547394 RepID=A0A4P6YCR8_9FLAO|nr:flavin reductase family protein [Flavobacterium nackdongense]QBN18505.1 flavin reductase family protein [Flavobacterium nackdongense]